MKIKVHENMCELCVIFVLLNSNVFKFLVSQQENVSAHGTYVEYVDSGLYATTAQGQSQM